MAAPQGAEGVNINAVGLGRPFIKQDFFAAVTKTIYWNVATVSQSNVTGPSSLLYTVNLHALFITNRFNTAQSVLIDNSSCRMPVRVTTDVGMSFFVPPFTFGCYPLICGISDNSFVTFEAFPFGNLLLTGKTTSSGAYTGNTRFSLLNKEHPPFEYSLLNRLPSQPIQGTSYNNQTFTNTFSPGNLAGAAGGLPLYFHTGTGNPVYNHLSLNFSLANGSGSAVTFATIFHLIDASQALVPVVAPYYQAAGTTIYKAILAFNSVPASATYQLSFSPVLFEPYVAFYPYSGLAGAFASLSSFGPSYLIGYIDAVLPANLYLTVDLNGSVGDIVVA